MARVEVIFYSRTMSMTFTKLFSSITESTIWTTPNHVRLVWITMLAMADSRGRVWASIPGLANRARVTLEEAEDAITRFLSPDKYSRTPDHEGRRIEPIDGGWRLLNHAKYRAIRDEEAIREAKRRYINTRRAVERAGVEIVDQCRTPSNTVERCRVNAEAEAEAISTPLPPKGGKPLRAGAFDAEETLKAEWPASSPVVASAWVEWVKYRSEMRKPLKTASARKQAAFLKALGDAEAVECMARSIRNGWQGLFPPDGNRPQVTAIAAPSRVEVQEYAVEKGVPTPWAINWFEWWNEREWRDKAGVPIDWKVRFSESAAKQRQKVQA